MLKKQILRKISLALACSFCMQIIHSQQFIERDPMIEKMVNEVSSDSM
jgi:hypothetical protein